MDNKKRNTLLILFILLTLGSALIFSNDKTHGHYWSFSYFSGAANLHKLFDWRISPSDFYATSDLPSDKYVQYKHQVTSDLVPNPIPNNYGYVLVVWLAMKFFPMLGDMQGVCLLQLIVHILLSLIVVEALSTKKKKIGFFLLYMANPLVIHFVTYPFYYFWMCLPSFLFVLLTLRPDRVLSLAFVSLPIMLLSTLIRPTTIFLTVFFYIIAYMSCIKLVHRILVAVLGVLFIGGSYLIWTSSNTNPWHTMYTGIGAYANNFGVNALSDDEAYRYFKDATGYEVDTHSLGGNWTDTSFRQFYMNVIKQRYLAIVNANPLLILKNAILNTLQSFSVGYIVNHPILNILSVFFGAFILSVLLYSRQYCFLLAILASSASFVWYFPPVPAYNFAAYMLIAIGLLKSLDGFMYKRDV